MESNEIGANQTHWKGVWPSAQYLGNFLCSNENVFRDSVCLELGSGTGVVGLALGKLGAKRGLDWQSEESIAAVLDSLVELDFLIASDVFYDVCTFHPLVTTITTFFDKFPKLRFYFGYAERELCSGAISITD
ncbi:hypothetical protein ANCDUO_11995 [Ancylostoma duodenale]|uniref:Methyltransferase small domain-containing protein n=1 Tax=Ancylostoma duodenale TaxID=51022 RepID=A0A0C2CMI0_9BILA|nr:hypothetical protein ANCDUO_11995 [Ancylostoma duodenale]